MAANDDDPTSGAAVPRGGTTAVASSGHDRSLVAAAVVGLGLGAFSVIADGVIPLRALVILGNIISPWAIAAFAVGRLSPSWQRGGWAGTLALLVGVVAYYVGQGVRLAVVTGDPAVDLVSVGVPLIWLVAAVTVGPLLGMAGAASKLYRPVPVAALVLPSVVLLAEAGFLVLDRRPWLWDLAREPHRLTDAVIMVGLAAAAFAIPFRAVPDRRRRLLIHGVTLVTAAAGSIALVGLYRVIVVVA